MRLLRIPGEVFVPMVIVMALIYVLAQSYEGRVELRDSQLHGCERGRLDRAANARGWRTAEHARYRDGDFDVASTYASIARGLEVRAAIDCETAFPSPSLLP